LVVKKARRIFHRWLTVAAVAGSILFVLPANAQKLSDLEQPKADSGAAAPGGGTSQSGGEPKVTKVGDWSLVCEPDGAPPCAMTQLGKDEQGSPAIEFVVRKIDDEEAEINGVKVDAIADIITPLGVLLEFGLRLKIDDGEERGAPFRICQQHGCLVREPLSGDVVNALKKGNKATVIVAAEGAGPVEIDISLRGFTKAYGSL
jgi:invasion protein IalB